MAGAFRGAALLLACLVGANASLEDYADEALCFVLNKGIAALATKPQTIPALSGGGGCDLRWSAGPGTINLRGVKATGCHWVKDQGGFGAAVSVQGIHVDGMPGYATDYKHIMWPVGCAHIGNAHFKVTLQATAQLQLVLPTTSTAKCQSQVSLPYFHDDIDVTDGGVEGSLKQKVMNALHAPIQQQIQQKMGGETTDKICSFVTGCRAGVHQCAAAAQETFEKCFNILHLNATACEAQAHQMLTQACAGVASKCVPALEEVGAFAANVSILV